jgi:prepilin-type processing-associated H-X9-DG protein
MADGMAGAAVGQHNTYRRIFYCPGAFTSVQDETNWWNYSSGHRVTSYQWLISRNGSQTLGGRSLELPKGFLLKINKPFTNLFNLASTEVVTDVIPSQGAAGDQTDRFTGVLSVNPTILPSGFNASHMIRNRPNGGNVLFLDSHVEWRRFREMECRFRWSSQRNIWF